MKACSLTVVLGGLLVAGLTPVTVAAQQKPGPAPGESLSQSYRGSQGDNVEYQKVPPIKVFDNLHYVGPGEVSVWLIPTTDGLILIDSSQEPLVDHVLDSIRKSGFDPRNIRYILLTKNPGRGNQDRGVPLMRDMVLREGQTITLGKTEIKVYKMPGHTPGSASFAFTVFDNGRPHKALVFGGPGQRNGVEGGTQFLESIRRLKREFSDVEVPVHVHSYLNTYPVPGGGAVFEPAQKLAQRKPGQPHPFVDNQAWRAWLDRAEAGTIKYIEQEKLKAQAPRSN
jgi:metallo-beta-lactamase class B